MEYAALIEHKNEVWRAFIPALADLDAEGVSRDEAVRNVQRAAEAYVSSVEVTTIKVNLPQELSRRPGSPQTLGQTVRVEAARMKDEGGRAGVEVWPNVASVGTKPGLIAKSICSPGRATLLQYRNV